MNLKSAGQLEQASLHFWRQARPRKYFKSSAQDGWRIAHATILGKFQFAIVWLAPTSAFLCFAAIWLKRSIRDFGLKAAIGAGAASVARPTPR